MGNNPTNKHKSGKSKRSRSTRRVRQVRQLAVLGGCALICVICLVMIATLNRPLDHQTSWRVEDGALNVDPSLAATPVPASESEGPVSDESDAASADFDDFSEADTPDAEDLPEDGFELSGEPEIQTGFEDFDAEASDGGAAMATFDEAAMDDSTAASADSLADFSDEPVGVTDAAAATATDGMTAPAAPALTEPVRLTITAAGDCTFGGCLKHDTFKVFEKYVNDYGYDYFFQNVRAVFQNDDLTIINLEGPLTDVGTMTTKSGICFRGEPAWTGIMTGSSIELCNFANNHNMDMGQEGFDRTLQALDEANIGYCVYDKVYHATIKGVRVTALGFDKWASKKEDVVAAVQRERPNCDLLIVNIHWGREMHYEPMSDQKAMGHAIIDAGADLVIGTHPHVYGGVELYKGKYIAYSLGNFCFGGNTVPPDQRCMIFQQVFEFTPGSAVTDGGINIIPCLVSGNPKRNDFQPYILDTKPGTTLLKKIAHYSINLGSVRWMPGSYPEQIGLLGGTAGTSGNAGDGATPEPTVTPVPELVPASEVFTEADGFDVDTAPQIQTTVEPLEGLGSRSLTPEEAQAFQEQIYQDQMSSVG